MKWWGWGEEDVTFTHADKPALRPFIQQHLGVDVAREASGPVAFGDLDVPAPAVDAGLEAALQAAVGADHVSGDALPNVLDGGPGSDHLRGRGGDDELIGAKGPIDCGSGRDTVRGGRSSRDLLEPDCEVLSPDHEGEISANPVVSRRRLRFVVTCPPNEDPDVGSPVLACGGGQVRVRELGARRRTLAVGRLPFGTWEQRVVRARLTPLGRRLAARRRGVKAGVRFASLGSGPAVRWAIRLKRTRH